MVILDQFHAGKLNMKKTFVEYLQQSLEAELQQAQAVLLRRRRRRQLLRQHVHLPGDGCVESSVYCTVDKYVKRVVCLLTSGHTHKCIIVYMVKRNS